MVIGENTPNNNSEQVSNTPFETLRSEPTFEEHMKSRAEKTEQAHDFDLNTSVGQTEYLGSYLNNKKAKWEERLEDDEYDPERVKPYIEEINFQQELLNSVGDEITRGGNLVDILAKKYDELYQVYEQDYEEKKQNYSKTGESFRMGESWRNMGYAENLCKTLAKQLTKNPQTAPYLSSESAKEQSDNDIRESEQIIRKKQAQLDNLNRTGNIDGKGIAHIINYDLNGNPVETIVDTNAVKEEIENAGINLKEIAAEKEVWGDLLSDNSSVFEHKTPLHKITRKSDLKPDVVKYIDERTPQIKKLLEEAKTLEKGTPEYQENETTRKRLAKERSAARRILVKYFSDESQSSQSESRETEQKVSTIDAVSIMDQMDADRDALEKNLEAVEKERQRRIDWEKSHYGYVEGEGRAPMSVVAAEEDMNRLRSKIIQKEKDADLLYKIYKENGKDQSLSSIEAQSIITKMIQDRDAKMAAIDEEIEKVEKKSERWKQLKQERAEIYRTVPDDVVERIMKLFN